MSWREQNESVDDRWQVGPNSGDRSRRRSGPRIGPIRITPTRVVLAIALVGSVAFLAYALTVRESTQIPLLASGAAVLGIVFTALAVAGLIATYRAAREGASGRAFGLAVLGGIAALIAFGCVAGAIIMALVVTP
jgi:hypothetical protein